MSKRYQALLQERADLVKEAQAVFSQAEKEGRDLTDEEKGRDDAINARLQTLAGEIEREERRREWERTVQAVPDANMRQAERGLLSVRDRAEDDPKRGFANLADFALAVKGASHPGGYVDERLRIGAAPADFHRETGSDEGYMIPPAMRDEIWTLVFDEPDLLSEVDSEPTSKNSVELIADESTPWGSTGVIAYWRSEGSQMSPTRLATKARTVRLYELYAFVLATDELLEDAPRLNDRLTNKSALAIRWKANQAMFEGTGAGTPLGWMKSAALVSQAKETNQAADTIVAANVAKMYSRVLNPSQAIWFINQDAFPQLMTMTLGNQPIWTPPQSGLQNAPGGLLFGRPVRFSEHCATVGDQGDIQLVSPKGYYAVSKRNAPQFASSIHLYFDYGIQAFRWTFRLGGQPHLSAAVTPAKGATTRSHFITLDARA